jgi:hypothetical protein
LNELDRNDVGWTNRIKEWPEGSGLKEVGLKEVGLKEVGLKEVDLKGAASAGAAPSQKSFGFSPEGGPQPL